MNSLTISTLILKIFFLHIYSILSEKILFILPLATKSETILFEYLARELDTKGHEITYVAPVEIPTGRFLQIIPTAPIKDTDIFKTDNLYEQRAAAKNKLKFIFSLDDGFLLEKCHQVYGDNDFQSKILSKTAGDFDLIIMSGLGNGCLSGLINKFEVPFIYVVSMPAAPWHVALTGLRQPPSFVPVPILGYLDKMDFIERLMNTFTSWLVFAADYFISHSKYTQVYRKFLGEQYPSMDKIEKNVSLILSNSHFSMNFLRPSLPDYQEIGGFHCRPAKLLANELDDFLSKSEHGFILFSLGSVINAKNMPQEIRQTFLTVFAKLTQNVLWKWDGEDMSDLPSNIRLQKWLPQQDILGHPNIRLFITHGGLLSTQEAAYHGVPLIGIPIFIDQDVNMAQAEANGYAIQVELLELSENSLVTAIDKILHNSSYKLAAHKISTVFKDQETKPLDHAIYWIEYILRYKGAPHLRSPARELNLFQYYSIDLLFGIFIWLISTWYLIVLYFSIHKWTANALFNVSFFLTTVLKRVLKLDKKE